MNIFIAIFFLINLLFSSAVWSQQEFLFALDAQTSSIFSIDPETGESTPPFTTPVLCQPEGACGLAYDGYSLFIVDATDRSRRIYIFNPEDGTLWHSIPSPSPNVDGLAFADGLLYALAFVENRIYQLDPFDGRALKVLEPGIELTGGLAAGGGRLFATQIEPLQTALIVEIDPDDGSVVQTFEAPGPFPAGLALLGDRLVISDIEQELLHLVDPDGGSFPGRLVPPLGALVGLAAGAKLDSPAYTLRLEIVAEELQAGGRVEFVLQSSLVDARERLLHTNDHAWIEFVVVSGEGEWRVDPLQQVSGGVATARLSVPVGSSAEVEAQLSGLTSAELRVGAVSPVVDIVLELIFDVEDQRMIEVEATLLDAFGGVAIGDSSAVQFSVVEGHAALVGAAVVRPEGGRAKTVIRLVEEHHQLRVQARVKELVRSAYLELEDTVPLAPEQTGGLRVSSGRAAGRDNIQPAPPTEVRAVLDGDQITVSWTLSNDDQRASWFTHDQQQVRRQGVSEYRIYRSVDGGDFEEAGIRPSGSNLFIEVVDVEGGDNLRYKVLAGDADNLSEGLIPPGSLEDRQRTVWRGPPRDAQGRVVQGLFNDDAVVDFADFFLFADHFSQSIGDEGFDEAFDLNGDRRVNFEDFFIFSDNFGRVAVNR